MGWNLEMTVGNDIREFGNEQNKQISIKLDINIINRIWVVSKLMNGAMTFVRLTRHHTTQESRLQDYWFSCFSAKTVLCF
jgi:hypothetical protein